MVKVSTLYYICDNLEENKNELIDIEMITNRKNVDYKEVWDLLDHLHFEIDQRIVKKVVSQVCQL